MRTASRALAGSGISVCFAAAAARRTYITQTRGRDRRAETCHSVLGLDPEDAPTAQDIERAFKRKARELGYAAVRRARERDSPRNQVPGVAPGGSSDDDAMSSLLSAYDVLTRDAGAAVPQQYASLEECATDYTLGLRAELPGAANFDPRRPRFVFTDQAARPLSDFRKVYEDVTGVMTDPLDGAAANCTAGGNVEFLLRLTFDEALSGCVKTLTFTRGVKCGACEATGKSRRRPQRCGECHGSGQLQLPSGTYVVKQECGHCGGDGQLPTPPCRRCNGRGVVPEDARYTVEIEPGVQAGDTMRLRGKGHAAPAGGRPGSLLVTLAVEAHRVFHRAGHDLHVLVPVPLSVALLGGGAPVPTPAGEATMRVAPCSTSGTVVTIAGQGAQRSQEQGGGRGSLLAHLLVVIPKADVLTGAQRASLAAFDPASAVWQSANAEELPEGGAQPVEGPAPPLDLAPFEEAKAAYGAWFPSADDSTV